MAETTNVEQIFQSWLECERGLLESWSGALKTNPMTAWTRTYEAMLQWQAAILRAGLKSLDPENGFNAFARSWIKPAESMTDIGIDCQRKLSQAWSGHDELQPEAVMRRWFEPWLDVTRAWQETAQKIVDVQTAWIKSMAPASEPEPTTTPPGREKAQKQREAA